MSPFTTLQHVQSAYLTYVHTFQKFQNPAIRDWVAERVRQDTSLLPWSSSTSESQHIRAGGRLVGVVSGRIWWLTVLDPRQLAPARLLPVWGVSCTCSPRRPGRAHPGGRESGTLKH